MTDIKIHDAHTQYGESTVFANQIVLRISHTRGFDHPVVLPNSKFSVTRLLVAMNIVL
jgi:hypothetical protein